MIRFKHGESKDDIANGLCRKRGVRDEVVFVGVTQEKAVTFTLGDHRKTGQL